MKQGYSSATANGDIAGGAGERRDGAGGKWLGRWLPWFFIVAFGLITLGPSFQLDWSLFDDQVLVYQADQMREHLREGRIGEFLGSFLYSPHFDVAGTFSLYLFLGRLISGTHAGLFHFFKFLMLCIFLGEVYLIGSLVWRSRWAGTVVLVLVGFFNVASYYPNYQHVWANWYKLAITEPLLIIFLLWTVYSMFRWIEAKGGSRWWFISFVLAYLLAVFTKVSANAVGCALLGWAVLVLLSSRQWREKRARLLMIMGAIVAITSLGLGHSLLVTREKVAYTKAYSLSLAVLERGLGNYLRYLYDGYQLLLPLCVISFAVRRAKEIVRGEGSELAGAASWAFLFSFAAGLLFMCFWPYTLPRYMLLFYPFLGLLMAGEFYWYGTELWRRLERTRWRCVFLAACFLVVGVLVTVALSPLYRPLPPTAIRFYPLLVVAGLIIVFLLISLWLGLRRKKIPSIFWYVSLSFLLVLMGAFVVHSAVSIHNFKSYYVCFEHGNEKGMHLLRGKIRPEDDACIIVPWGLSEINGFELLFEHLYGYGSLSVKGKGGLAEANSGDYLLDHNFQGNYRFNEPRQQLLQGWRLTVDQVQREWNQAFRLSAGRVASQHFRTSKDARFLTAIEIRGDNIQWHSRFNLVLRLFESGGKQLAETLIRGGEVGYARRDRHLLVFPEPVPVEPEKEYYFELQGEDSGSDATPAGFHFLGLLYTGEDSYGEGHLVLDGGRQEGDLAFVIYRAEPAGWDQLGEVRERELTYLLMPYTRVLWQYLQRGPLGYQKNFSRLLEFENSWVLYQKEN